MEFPKELKYSKDHEWLRVEGNNAIIGITEFAQGELGDIVFVDIDSEGETLEKEEVFGSVEAVKTVSDLFMPINGEIVTFNKKLEGQPELTIGLGLFEAMHILDGGRTKRSGSTINLLDEVI